ncbi:MAG: TIGR03905 family TSCPD domain-containing protein [Oscillospiraceae bacterium]|jgi:uncharacterized protein (TIGR03905 family)|nr:TIGR03905 family TSCPD domain-containing protein [Oscillospiraceae bacterium]
MTVDYKPKGICAKNIKFDVEDGIIKSVDFDGGCPGNLLGISKLVVGQKASDIIEQFDGLKCGNKATSCPDQLAKALKAYV